MPSFAIETPAETNPLSEPSLLHTLRSASSSDSHQIQTGTKQLQQWERTPGYYRHLQSAYLDSRLPLEIRYLAIIQLKNGIDKYWRKTALNAVAKVDKDAIRERLLSAGLEEVDDRLALQSALVVAKIARFEFPAEWPDVLSSLVQVLRAAGELPPLRTARALLMLLYVVKELSTGRLQRTRQNLQAATPEIVVVLTGLYAETVSYWQQGGLDESAMKLSLLTIKVLRRLLVQGYEHPHRNEEVVAFWRATQQHLSTFMQLGQQLHSPLLEKNMLQLAKLHHEMAKEHPAAFALLPNSVELATAYWGLVKDYGQSFGSTEVVTSAVANASIGTDGDADDDKPATEKLALRGLLILRACVKMVHSPAQTFKYRQPADKAEKKQATELLRSHLLSHPFIQETMEVIVTRFFVFRRPDLREWAEEPEEWEKREEGDGEDWEFSIRSCAEKLFLDLAINYKDVLVQPLLAVFYQVARLDNEDVLFKDSVYTAIGLAAPVVHEHLDFDAFIRDVLVAEVQKTKPGFNLVRRRAAILLAQWISVRCAERALVLQVFQHLLGKDEEGLNDQVVRVTAGRQLARIVDDWDTRAEQLRPYLDPILERLMQLIDEVELTDTKMALLNTISCLVERMEYAISPFAERIVGLLPALWEASGEEHLMKQAILTILARLVNAMKVDSRPLHAMVFPIIKGAVQPGSDSEVYLLDDALDLWASVLVQTAQPASPDLLDLVPDLFPLYDLGSDHLRKALELTESYLLLSPIHLLHPRLRQPLLTALKTLLQTLPSKPEPNALLCNLAELLLRSAAASDPETLTALLHDLSPFIQTLLHTLHASYAAHCTTGPRAAQAPVDGIVETDYFSVLARLVLADLNAFTTALAGDPATIRWLLEEWFAHFANIGDPSRRKLMALALTRLLDTGSEVVLGSLQSLMTVWTDVLTELRESARDLDPTTDGNQDAGAGIRDADDALVYAPPSDPPDPLEAPEDTRRRALLYSDDVHTISLPAWIRAHLQRAMARAEGGVDGFRERWVGDVDREVVEGFMGLGVL
ncbi:hypothetical protein B0A50_06284 [Salinomyces thailandicus]|uniref:Importin N-terminal domain-containing protein n=1 Tax=Salinomyces thailandicus TaxID=706561 RepID=A0A4U0TTE7_9PEZI|nr:hypothetical protein B0A50_06284 [Salinomyces thailandica]